MRRAIVAIAVTIFALVGLGFWYFRSGDTRLTLVPVLPGPIAAAASASSQQLPKAPRSIVVIIEENKSYRQIFGDARAAPYLNSLARQGALFTHSYAVAHPSQPNYMAFFSGRTNANGDRCPARGIAHDADNLGAELIAAHRTFRAYVESLPSPGFAGCSRGKYARKHAPWTQFSNVPTDDAIPFSALHSYSTLPTVAFVIPNLVHDMHSASIARGDTWLRTHIKPLIAWAKGHNTLVIITWDESSAALTNHIPTLFIGPMVKPGRYGEIISHYRVLRTIEDLFNLKHAGAAFAQVPILDCWQR